MNCPAFQFDFYRRVSRHSNLIFTGGLVLIYCKLQALCDTAYPGFAKNATAVTRRVHS